MRLRVRTEAEILASVAGLSVVFGGQCHRLITKISKKGLAVSDYIYAVNWKESLMPSKVAGESL
jgi:hypothetical protein